MTDLARWTDGTRDYTLHVTDDGAIVLRGIDDRMPHSIVRAFWSHNAARERRADDITGLCQLLAARLNAPDEWPQLRVMIADALTAASQRWTGTLGRDACGVVDLDGTPLAWWHTNAYTRWLPLADCDDDERRDLADAVA